MCQFFLSVSATQQASGKHRTFLANEVVVLQQTLLFTFTFVELLPFVERGARSGEQGTMAMRKIQLTSRAPSWFVV